MHEHDMGTIAERTVLTPAERAVLVEQAETAKIALETFAKHCREGTAGEAIKAFVPIVQGVEYMTNIINTKVAQTIQRDHEEGREH